MTQLLWWLLEEVDPILKKCCDNLTHWKVPFRAKYKKITLHLTDDPTVYAYIQEITVGRYLKYDLFVSDQLYLDYKDKNLEEALENVLYHELLHSIDGCMEWHSNKWKAWCKKLNVEHGTKISPFARKQLPGFY